MAAAEDKWECMELLLIKGANVNVQDTKGKTPLVYATGKLKCEQVIKNYIGKNNML